jgi:hypothetical protein
MQMATWCRPPQTTPEQTGLTRSQSPFRAHAANGHPKSFIMIVAGASHCNVNASCHRATQLCACWVIEHLRCPLPNMHIATGIRNDD